jgi:beta-N-acetylglucosaminidase
VGNLWDIYQLENKLQFFSLKKMLLFYKDTNFLCYYSIKRHFSMFLYKKINRGLRGSLNNNLIKRCGVGVLACLITSGIGAGSASAATTVFTPEPGKAVHYNWGWGSPKSGVPADNFSAVFDQSGNFADGDYFLQTFADDGIKVEVDGKFPINRWSDFTGKIDRALWLGVNSGRHTVKTHYYENVASAGVFSDVVPFDSWLAYYYPNETLSGMPTAAKVITPSPTDGLKKLSEDFGWGQPAGGISADHFSARYTTAKHIPAGDYILRARADDGIRVYVDGKLVIDRWTTGGFREDAVKFSIADRPDAEPGEKDVHWVEVEYLESVAVGKMEFFLEPFQKATENEWVGEIYPNMNLEGKPYIMGGRNSLNKISKIDFNWGWGLGSPLDTVPGDKFSARFTKKVNIDAGKYLFNANGDDGVRVYLDNKLIINSWPGEDYKENSQIIDVSAGNHTIVVEYLEDVALASLNFNYQKVAQLPVQKGKTVHYNWGWGTPMAGIPADYFTGTFDQSGTYESGDYFLQTLADDGVKVEADGKMLVNRWSDFTGKPDRALWMDVNAGEHTIKTHYYEAVAEAAIFSDVVPFDSWLAYYYPNENLVGKPAAVKVIHPSPTDNFKKLSDDFGWGQPVAGISADHFSARYTTAKHLPAGDYILRARADDGIRVYVDGKLAVDRWTTGGFREDAVKFSIADRPDAKPGEEDVHWIEVEYLESVAVGKVEFFLEPFQKATETTWVGEIFPNMNLQGDPFIIGGDNSLNPFSKIDFDWGWGLGSPLDTVPGDKFSARFTKKVNLETGTYLFNLFGDDGVRVFLDNQLVIDSWTSNDYKLKKQALYVEGGIHTIRVEYFEDIASARVMFDYQKLSSNKIFYQFGEQVQFNWGSGSPSGFPSDKFESIFDQSQVMTGGDYLAQTFADDGVRVTVDDQIKINRWSDSTGKLDQAYLLNLSPGEHKIQTDYYENTGNAMIYSHVVPFGTWVGYYYPNSTFSGNPTASKVIPPSGNKDLYEHYQSAAPVTGFQADNFTAVYRTAKRLPAGEYVIRAKADDGVKVYLDGKLVVNQKELGDLKEMAVKINIQDLNTANPSEKDVHSLMVEYYEESGPSYLDVDIQQINEVMSTDQWVGFLYPTINLSGQPVVLGGAGSAEPLNQINFNWERGKPHSLIPADGFSGRFVKKAYFNGGVYKINTISDDGIRVYVDGKLKIDSWVDSGPDQVDTTVILDAGVHEVVVEYYENVFTAELKVDIVNVSSSNARIVGTVQLPAYRSFAELSDYRIHHPFYNPSYTRFFELGYGDLVYILEEYQYGVKIQTQAGDVGWVQKEYLEQDVSDDLWLVKDGRTLRSNAVVSSSNIGWVPTGAKVRVLDHVTTPGTTYTEWYKVQTEGGQIGWIWGAISTNGNTGYNLIKYEFQKAGTITNQVNLFTPLNTKANVTADQINRYIAYRTGGKSSVMTGMGNAYLIAQEQSGLNAIYLLAHSGLETGWGTSPIVNKKYNFYGIGAIDSQPDEGAYNYNTPEGGIVAGASWISSNYVIRSWDTDTNIPYYQPTIDNMRFDNSWHQYAADEAWAAKISYYAQDFYNFINR